MEFGLLKTVNVLMLIKFFNWLERHMWSCPSLDDLEVP